MKKVLLVMISILFLNVFSVLAKDEENDNEFELDEIGTTVSIPTEYSVFMNDYNGGSGYLENSGLTYSDVLTYMENYNAHLVAFAEDGLSEISIVLNQDKFTESVNSFNAINNFELENSFSPYIRTYEEQGLVVNASEIYVGSSQKFLHFSVESSSSNVYFGEVYYTVINGVGFTIRVSCYDESDVIEDIYTSNKIVDNLKILDKYRVEHVEESHSNVSKGLNSLKSGLRDEATFFIINLLLSILSTWLICKYRGKQVSSYFISLIAVSLILGALDAYRNNYSFSNIGMIIGFGVGFSFMFVTLSYLFIGYSGKQEYPLKSKKTKSTIDKINEIVNRLYKYQEVDAAKEEFSEIIIALKHRIKESTKEEIEEAIGSRVEGFILAAVSNASGDYAESGEFHMYRGVLSPKGEKYLKLFLFCIRRLHEIGEIEEEYRNQQIEQIYKNISSVG